MLTVFRFFLGLILLVFLVRWVEEGQTGPSMVAILMLVGGSIALDYKANPGATLVSWAVGGVAISAAIFGLEHAQWPSFALAASVVIPAGAGLGAGLVFIHRLRDPTPDTLKELGLRKRVELHGVQFAVVAMADCAPGP